jgi:hypothetical protein
MKTTNQYMVISFIFALGLSACTKQAWYQGAQSAKTANCMKEPISEFDECKQQSDDSYHDYERSRKDLTEDPSTSK